jgi:hypothetical protein
MGTDRSLAACDERAQRAALRETVLQYGRQIGWPARTAIVFTERATRRPWKRCTSGQLRTVLDELDAILRARIAPDPRRNGPFDQAGQQPRKSLPRAGRGEPLDAHRD